MADGGDGERPRGRAGDAGRGEAVDPVARAALLFELFHDLAHNHRNPVAKRIVKLWVMHVDAALEYLGEEANARGENFGRDIRQALRNTVLRDLAKTKTAKAIAEAIANEASGHSAIELLTENPYEPGSDKHKIRQVLMFNGGSTIGERRIDQILKRDTI